MMRKFKFKKKEYLVVEKDKLDLLKAELSWRFIETRLERYFLDSIPLEKETIMHLNKISMLIDECNELLSKFEESL